jgi:hypothetical protein
MSDELPPVTILINNYVNVNNDSNSSNDSNDTNDSNISNISNDNSNNDNDNNSDDEEKDDEDICVICLEKIEENNSIRACKCANSYHIKCLLTWIKYKDSYECEICKSSYDIPNNIILQYYDEIEDIRNNRIKSRRNAVGRHHTEELERLQILENYRIFKDRICYCYITICLIGLFTCGIFLLFKRYT